MFTLLPDLPSDVLGVRASGPISHEDYLELIPKAEALMSKGPIKALYIVDDDISEFSPQAFWDDQTFGLKHWRDFSHLAIVTDLGWVKVVAKLFGPIFPAKMKLFDKAHFNDAKAWILSAA